jgi:outer membrane protein insertion porin family
VLQKQTAPKKQTSVRKRPAPRKAPPLITKIHLLGLSRLTRENVMQMIHSQVGEVLSMKTLNGDIRRLNKTGWFSAPVRVGLKSSPGLVELFFVLKEKKQFVRLVYFSGNRIIRTNLLQKAISTKAGTLYNRKQLLQDARAIISLYHQVGYFRVQVGVNGGRAKGGGLLLYFQIDEGGPARIRNILLRGNRTFTDKQLMSVVESKTPGILQPGAFNRSLVQRDVYFLKLYYQNRGFLNVRIPSPTLTLSPDRDWVTLTYNISEGPRFRYGRSSFDGDLVFSKKALSKMVHFKSGQWFSRTGLYRKTINPMIRRYQNKGYTFARIQPIPLVRFGTFVDILFRVRKGKRYRIGKIVIKGNKKTLTRVIRRRMWIKEGEWYHRTRLEQTQRRVYGLGFFKPTDQKLGVKVNYKLSKRPGYLILEFLVIEKSTFGGNIGPSFLPERGFLFAGTAVERNFLGRGWIVQASGTITTTLRLWFVNLSLIDPHILNTDLLVGASFSRVHDSIPSLGFARDTLGANLNFSHPIGLRQLRAMLSYSFSTVELSPENPKAVRIKGFTDGAWRKSRVGLGLQWDSRNNHFSPKKGSYHFVRLRQTSDLFGADYTMTRLEAGTRWYFSLPLSMTFRVAGTVGWLYSPDPNGAPPFERYNLGGIDSLRGYRLGSVSPKQTVPSSSDPTFNGGLNFRGGNKQLFVNAELELPVFRLNPIVISAVVFLDMGNAFAREANFFEDPQNNRLFLGMYTNIGFGVRFLLPNLGVMRLEWGIPLNPRPGDPGLLVNFTVGSTIF